MAEHLTDEERQDEQLQLAREIGEELTDAFIAYVKGDVSFEDLTFGVFDALSDLHVIAGGNYELTGDDDHEHDHEHDHDDEDEEGDDDDEGDSASRT
jgi:hypothetical protein